MFSDKWNGIPSITKTLKYWREFIDNFNDIKEFLIKINEIIEKLPIAEEEINNQWRKQYLTKEKEK